MTRSDTLTIRLTPELNSQLQRLAACSQRTKSFLAAEAISRFIQDESEIIEGIIVAQDEIKSGKGIPHSEAMQLIRDEIASASGKIVQDNGIIR